MKVLEKAMKSTLPGLTAILESIHARLELSNENEEKIIKLLEKINKNN